MFAVLLATIGLVSAAPLASSDWSDLIKEANEAKTQISALSKDEQSAVFLVLGILGNTTMTEAQKKSTITELMKEAPADAKKEVEETTSKTFKYNDWLTDRLKNEDPAVQSAINKIVGLMTSQSFVMSTDDEKKTQLNAAVQGLTEAQQAAIKKIDTESSAKEKELGLDKN